MTENKLTIEILDYKDYLCRNKDGKLVKLPMQNFPPQREGDIWIGNKWVNQYITEIGIEVTDQELLDKFKELTWEDEPYRITRNTFDPEKQMEVELNSPAPMTRVVMLFKVHKLIPIESPGMVRSELEKIIGEPYFNELRSMGFIEGNWIQDSVSKIAYYQYKLTELGMNYCNELFR